MTIRLPKEKFKVIASVGLMVICCILLWNSPSTARSPLLVDGKKTLFQRIITHPGAVAYSSPSEGAGSQIRAFTPLYVYGRTDRNGEDWLEVSPSTNSDSTAWIKNRDCSRWDKALTMMFTERMGREPALFFKTYADLNRLISSDTLPADIDMLLAQYGSGNMKADSPLVALEPINSAIPQKQFYLMPVFEYSQEYQQYNMQLLKVGCINPGSGAKTDNPAHFSAAVVFIVDTTISMGPYIEETKRFIHSTYNALERNPLAENLYLGLVAFRNSTKFNPKIGYISRIISPLTSSSGREGMEKRLNDFDEATVSTHSFNEDAFAGIMTAVNQLDWSSHAIKLAVLITDAGAIRNSDKYSSTGLNEDEIRDLLAQKGIRLLVVHLQTPAGKKHNPGKTENQYKTLTSVPDKKLKSAYLKLQAQNPSIASKSFGSLSAALVKTIMKIIEQTEKGYAPQKPKPFTPMSPEENTRQIAESIGYAAQLEFAGKGFGTRAPEMIEAWTVDKDLVALSEGSPTETLSVAVLLNKRQLDSLGKNLQMIIDAAKASRSIDSGQLFERLISLSAQTLRDPSRLEGASSAANLSQLGVLPEFMDDLPYKSWIMTLTPEAWSAMNSAEQDNKIRDLESKVQLYREYHNDVANWVNFGSPDPADALYRVPLTSLP